MKLHIYNEKKNLGFGEFSFLPKSTIEARGPALNSVV